MTPPLRFLMHYVYVLRMSNDQLYFGSAKDLRQRVEDHKRGKVFATKKYLPISLLYYECYLSEKDAKRREYMLKRYGSSYVHLKERIKDSIQKSQGRGLMKS